MTRNEPIEPSCNSSSRSAEVVRGKRVRVSVLLLASVFAGCAEGSSAAPDGAALAFENLRVEEIGASRAVVRFETSVPATCEIEYGRDPTKLSSIARDPNMAAGALSATHAVPIEDLAPATTYHFRARATDGHGRTAFSPVATFTTLPAANTGPAGANLALSSAGTKVVDFSSIWANGTPDSDFGVNQAIDGLMTTAWSSNGDGDQAFLTLDLGEIRQLGSVGFRSRSMDDGTSIILAFRLIFDEGAQVRGPFEAPDPSLRYAFPLAPPVAARRVRLEAVCAPRAATRVYARSSCMPRKRHPEGPHCPGFPSSPT
jgi:hypothetical protein